MKNQLSISIILGLVSFSSTAFAAEEKDVGKHQVPRAVHEAFQKAYPNAKEVKYKEEISEGKAAYEIEFKEKGKEIEALYSPEGVLIETEEEIKITELPEAIVQTIKKDYPKATLKEAEKTIQPDGKVSGYEVEIKEGGKEIELELDASGKILKSEAEEKD